ncbi:hypothetical protein IWW50_004006, partial [Coemansia erecta]
GMSARVAQTIALGSQFVDQRMLNPIVRSAAQTEAHKMADDLADATELDMMEPTLRAGDHAEPDDEIAEHMVELSLRSDEPKPKHADEAAAQSPEWVNAPQEPKANTPYDPYENLLDEVDQLLDEITDGEAANPDAANPQHASLEDTDLDAVLSPTDISGSQGVESKSQHKDLDFHVDDDDDDDDDDLTQLLKDKD